MTESRKICYILRHAKARPGRAGELDSERPLTPRGIRDARQIAQYMAARGYRPNLVLCSAAFRTRETLANMIGLLPPSMRIETTDSLYMAGSRTLLRCLQRLNEQTGTVLLIGHNPGLADLAAELAGQGEPADITRIREKFPTCALACLALGTTAWATLTPGTGRLTDLAYPRDLDED